MSWCICASPKKWLHLSGGLSDIYTLLWTSRRFPKVQFLVVCKVLYSAQVKGTGENRSGLKFRSRF